MAAQPLNHPTAVREAVVIRYTNYRGETAKRRIVPKTIYFGATEWHPHAQWLLDAYDLEKQADRSFAVKDIHDWTPLTPQ